MLKDKKSKWITGKELITRWDIKDFELFDFLKQGLQPYTRYGKKIIDSDSLRRARRDSIDKIERDLRTKQKLIVLGGSSFGRMTESQIKDEAQRIYNRQKLEIVNPPNDCVLMSFSIPQDENGAKIAISRTMNFLFKMDDILEFEKEHPQFLRETKQILEKTVFPCKPGTKWEDITIILVADDMIRVKTPQGEGLFTYHKLGFADQRKGDKPTMLWTLLQEFAKGRGRISRAEKAEYISQLPSTAKRLDKHLQKVFRIKDRIYKDHYKTEKGYTLKLTILDRRETGD